MASDKKFHLSVGDEPEYEDLTAEINYDGLFFALISQEEGFEHLRIEIYPREDGEKWCFKVTEFIEVIELSKKRLWELRKVE